MKKEIIFSLMALSVAAAGAQTVYDATAIAQKELNGTARFVGMGGAMGALGGDISTIDTNPAGIGIYRSNDAMLTLGYSVIGTESNYLGRTAEQNKYRWGLDNAGVVISNKIGNHTALRYLNFGFNYHKTKSLYKNMTMQGMMGTFDNEFLSQTHSMAQQGTASAFDYGRDDLFYNNNAGWLSGLGYQGWLTGKDEETANSYFSYIPDEAFGYYGARERGGIDQYDFNISFNVNDRFYFGFTVGAYDVDYYKNSLWSESYGTDEGYDLNSYNRIHGTGIDAKFGVIFRPIETSPLRIGLSVHTPTFYQLTYTTGARLISDVLMEREENEQVTTVMERYDVNTLDYLDGRDMDRDFELRTPWVFNASLGYTVGNYLALGAEYEYEDYSSMKFNYPDGGEMMWETGEADLCMKGVSTLRLGAEYKPIPAFSMRLGYNYSSSAFKEDAIKALPSNSINTDTDFANTNSMNTFTLGIGYRGSLLYADLAYKYDMYKSDFYPFYNEMGDYLVTPEATKVTNSRSKVMLTVGVRF